MKSVRKIIGPGIKLKLLAFISTTVSVAVLIVILAAFSQMQKFVAIGDNVASVDVSGDKIGLVRQGYSQKEMESEIARMRRQIIFAGLLAIFMGIIITFILATFISRPVRMLMKAAGQVAAGDLSVKVEARSGGGVGQMISAFNLMIGNLKSAHDKLGSVNQKLQNQVDEYKIINEELDRFVYTASHDLKTPLVSIQGFSNLLVGDYGEQLDEEGKMYIERIQANSEHMGILIENLLELSRIGRMDREKEFIDTMDIISDVSSELAPQLDEKGTRLVINGEIPAVWYNTVRLSEVFTNLLDNANKYMGEGNDDPVIEIGCSEQGEFYTFYIRDNGIGIDKEYHDKIFGLFQRLNDIKAEGTGIGLAIVKKIIEGNGGSVWIDSTKEQGTTIYFTVPKDNK